MLVTESSQHFCLLIAGRERVQNSQSDACLVLGTFKQGNKQSMPVGQWVQQAGGLTSSFEDDEKLTSIAPATVPAAIHGP